MESDFEAYTSILESLNSKTIELIGDGQDRETTEIVFRGCSFIWNSGNFEALRVGNHQFYDTIWECIEELYEYAAKEKIDLLNYEYVDFFVMDFIKFLSRNKLGDSLAKGVKVIANVFKLNLKYNCPPQEQINDLYYMFEEKNDEERLPHYINSSIQWNKINDLIYQLNAIQTSAIEIVDKELFDTCKFELDRIIQEISYKSFPDLKIYQEAYIIVKIINHQTNNAYEANQENLFKESMWTFEIKRRFISDLVKNEKFYVGRILEQISDFIIKSQRNERLDYYFSLNYWGALGRNISKFYFVNDIAKKAIIYILDTLDVLKKEIEENQLPNQAQNYIETKKQFESIKKWLVKDNEGQVIPEIERIDKTLDSYIEVIEKKDFRIVKWDDEKINQ